MGESNPSICIQCSQSTDQTRRLNRLEDGSVCTICRDRLLDQLAPMLPNLSYSDSDVEAQVAPADPERDPGPESA